MALTSGIGTLIGGGSLKDAFKSAVISGGIAGIAGGAKGFLGAKEAGVGGWEGFKQGVIGSAYNPAAATAAASEIATKSLSEIATSPTEFTPAVQQQGTTWQRFGAPVSAPGSPSGGQIFSTGTTPGGPSMTTTLVPPPDTTVSLSNVPKLPPETTPGFWDKTGDILFRGGESTSDIATNAKIAGDAYLADTPQHLQTAAGWEAAKATAQPSMLAKWGPTVAAGTLAGAATGMFDTVPQDEVELADAPLGVAGQISQPIIPTGQIDVATQFPIPTAQQLLVPTPAGVGFAAQGGAVNYPRREALVEGPGTTTSDDIPAMLSDGEFVINSKAVQGADPSGRGNRYAEAQNLYNMMRNFEMRA